MSSESNGLATTEVRHFVEDELHGARPRRNAGLQSWRARYSLSSSSEASSSIPLGGSPRSRFARAATVMRSNAATGIWSGAWSSTPPPGKTSTSQRFSAGTLLWFRHREAASSSRAGSGRHGFSPKSSSVRGRRRAPSLRAARRGGAEVCLPGAGRASKRPSPLRDDCGRA